MNLKVPGDMPEDPSLCQRGILTDRWTRRVPLTPPTATVLVGLGVACSSEFEEPRNPSAGKILSRDSAQVQCRIFPYQMATPLETQCPEPLRLAEALGDPDPGPNASRGPECAG